MGDFVVLAQHIRQCKYKQIICTIPNRWFLEPLWVMLDCILVYQRQCSTLGLTMFQTVAIQGFQKLVSLLSWRQFGRNALCRCVVIKSPFASLVNMSRPYRASKLYIYSLGSILPHLVVIHFLGRLENNFCFPPPPPNRRVFEMVHLQNRNCKFVSNIAYYKLNKTRVMNGKNLSYFRFFWISIWL